MLRLNHEECSEAAGRLAGLCRNRQWRNIYPVPRGGVPVAYLMKAHWPDIQIVQNSAFAHVIIDDIIDSGATRDRYSQTTPFMALVSKMASYPSPIMTEDWVHFPWEGEEDHNSGEDIAIRLLQYIGEDSKREGLLETPKRMLKAWKYWTKGYKENPEDILKVFEDGAEGADEMIVVKDIPVYSHCEHHLAMIIGTATVAYVPNGKIVGLSKIARLVDVFARRLQVQERLTSQIADAMDKYLSPLGVGVVIRARHMCMESRGIEKMGAETITSALRGVFKDGPARAEFLALERSK